MKRFYAGAVLLLTAFSLNAAVDMSNLSLFGQVRIGSWLTQNDRILKDSFWIQNPDSQVFLNGDPRPNNQFTLSPYGAFGFNYKGDRIGVTIEMGVGTSVSKAYKSGATSDKILQVERYMVTLRKFFAEVYLGDFASVLIGQDYAPACFITTSNQQFYDNNCFLNTGSLYTGRRPMLEFIYSNLKDAPTFGIEGKVAVVKVDTVAVQYIHEFFPYTNSKIPKFEGSINAKLNLDHFGIDCKLVGGYQQYELVLPSNFDPRKQWSDPVDCYIYGAHLGLKLGPVYLNGDIGGGQNLGSYGAYVGNPYVERGSSASNITDIFYPSFAGTNFQDSVKHVTKSNSHAYEWDVILGVKPLSWLGCEGGFGFVHAERDSAISATWHDTYAGYFQVEFKIMEIITLTPEVGMYYYGPKLGYGRIRYAGFSTVVEF